MDNDTLMIIIIVVACVVVFVILLVFIGVACHLYKRRKSVDNSQKPMTDVGDVDAVVRAETGKHEHVITSNPAFGKEDLFETEGDLAPRAVDLAQEFDGEFEEGKEASETGSNYSFTPDPLQDSHNTKLSILDQHTWGGMHVNGVNSDADFDFNMFHPIRGLHSKSDGNIQRSSSQSGQSTADLYESGQALTANGIFSMTNPGLNNTTGARLLWQKKRFKNF